MIYCPICREQVFDLRICKGIFAERNALRQLHRFQRGTAEKCVGSDACHAVRNCDSGQAGTAEKCALTDACHAVRNGNSGQAGAAIKCEIINAFKTIWKTYRI